MAPRMNQVQVVAADGNDKLSLFRLYTLTGGVRWCNGTHADSETPWAYGFMGFRYAFDAGGNLEVQNEYLRDADGKPWTMFFADGKSGPDVAPADRSAGLYVVNIDISAKPLMMAANWGIYDLFKVTLGDFMKAMTGYSLFAGVDPIVLDLNGGGLELTTQTSSSPRFDMDSDGFAEPTGWGWGEGVVALVVSGSAASRRK
jgi:hypothetical protein